MATKVVISRVDTAANFTNANPLLALGEEGYEIDSGLRKVGDGSTLWNSLPYDGTNDHNSLDNLTVGDPHTQYLNETRHDNLPNDNPHGVTKAQVGLGNADNTSDLNKPISTATQAALNLKYDASNPNSYETPAQLNTRDTNNRARANHTGTQLAATISDLPAAIQANETNTSLILSANQLTYTREDGTTQSYDLSVYLDDTNAARIESGVISATTGIATFTRDDATDFTVDMSAFLDGITDHNALSNLTVGDPHTQYLNESRGDARYYTQTQLDGGQLNTIYTPTTIINSDNAAQNSNISSNASGVSANTSAISSNSGAIATIQSEQTTQDNAITLNTAKVSADGSINTHSDVDLSGIVLGESVKWDGTKLIPSALLNGFTVFPVWAEESGGLSNNNQQWSFGNGATGDIGIPLGTDCELFAVSMQADANGTSVSIDFERNSVAVHTQLFNGGTDTQAITAVPFSFGDRISFRTNTETGNYNDVRVCAWFRLSATAVFPTPDRMTVDTSGNFTSTAFATVPGATTTVTLTDVGTVDATATYSAARAGAANSEAQFRVVINGDNGPVFNDTLSTFNDTGPVSHFVEGLPAGTYTVSLEAAVSQPIDFAIVVLTATAVED